MIKPVEQYRREQEALERQRDLMERAKDFDFISMMLKALGMGDKR